MTDKLYTRLCCGVDNKGSLKPVGHKLTAAQLRQVNGWFESIYYYTQAQELEFQVSKSIAGVTDVVTNKLVYDFDNKENPDLARVEAETVYLRLRSAGIQEKDIAIYFSGHKGFHLVVLLDRMLTPKQMRALAHKYGQGAKYDPAMYDHARTLRVPFSFNKETGLYKIPLARDQFVNLGLDEIKHLAATVETAPNLPPKAPASPGDEFYRVPEPKPEPKPRAALISETGSLDFSQKPKFLTNCRWRLQNGQFKTGDRNNAFLCLAATYKNLGFGLDHVYRMLKATAEMQAKFEGSVRYSDAELHNNIAMYVFGPTFHNGQYSCREAGNFLQIYCDSDPVHCCKKENKLSAPHTMLDIVPSFKEYVKNIDKNTVTLGLPSLDKNIFISTGCNLGIIGAAASGKSALALNILNHTSKNNVNTVFASLDMHRNRMFEKVMYKITGKSRKDLYEVFQKNQEGPWIDVLKKEFGNVFFFNQSCPSVQDVRDYIMDCQEQRGEKIKLVMLDYFERVTSEFSDDTQASKKVAGALQDMVNDLDIALITLVQPHKAALAGGPDLPILDYTKIKGSSFVYQSFRIILSMNRPGYSPRDFKNDKYMQMFTLKNDLGELAEFAFNWNGARGEITEMDDFQRDEMNDFLAKKVMEAAANKASTAANWGL